MPFIHFGNSTDVAATAEFLCPCYLDAAADAVENNRLYTIPCAGTVRGMYVQALTNALAAAEVAVVTLRRGDTTCTATLAAGVLNNSDFAHPIAVAAGDRISIHWVPDGAGHVCTYPQVTLVFTY
jgi:hypothetical protein